MLQISSGFYSKAELTRTRINISNALTLNLPRDLALTGPEPNVALTIFFVPYVLFEIPSNILMKKFRPHIWLSGCIFSFGVIMLCQGFVSNYSGILATRFFLGLVESGIFPGSFYLISVWYRFEEAQTRFTFYWCSVIIAGAFGGLLASAIAKMDGIQGLANWRWIFILEGLLTISVGVLAFFCLSDFPKDAKWLSPEERQYVVDRTGAAATHTSPITLADVRRYLSDIKSHLGALMYFSEGLHQATVSMLLMLI